MKKGLLALFLCIVVAGSLSSCKAKDYTQAEKAYAAGNYAAAQVVFDGLGDYKDSRVLAQLCKDQLALQEREAAYTRACSYLDGANWDEAIETLKTLSGYEDSDALLAEAYYGKAEMFYSEGKYVQAVECCAAFVDQEKFQVLKERCEQAETAEKYSEALELYFDGGYSAAQDCFEALGDWEAAEAYTILCRMKQVEPGDEISFGSYPQGEAGEVEPILWRVLSVEENRVLLLSVKGLKYDILHESLYPFWSDSHARAELNGDFFETAFSDTEQKLVTAVTNTTKSYLGAEGFYLGGPDTVDTVFLLSKEEVAFYLPEDEDRLCLPTAFSLAQGAEVNPAGYVGWWTRSPGDHHGRTTSILPDGRMYAYRMPYYGLCLRPAIYIDRSIIF